MAQQIDPNQLKKAEAATTLAKSLISQAIEQSAANPTLCEEALKQASMEITQAQTMISQAQSTLQASSQQSG
ncbi:hypothetical protein [Paenibacillus aceris]|uniref:DUF2564 family protein n=1 Tax=Paenibacillus aceris TaxID=869555 RepID=A0ABS4I709_9BACL|nr:hypothetical protein [Paenibacillus aceris]MBP1966712.1 hypothetical protein [Paenibacillus aceris]NHW34974.1 hypothetical protein [Paenibacillus aceris]